MSSRAIDRIRAEAEQLCYAIAPELHQRDFAIVLASELPSPYAGDAAAGCVMRGLADLAESYVNRKGAAILINDATIQKSVKRASEQPMTLCGIAIDDLPRADEESDFRLRFFEVTTHECAHLADIEQLDRQPEPVADVDRAGKALALVLSDATKQDSGPKCKIPFAGHAHRFIRACLHLTWRARQHGYDLSYSGVVPNGYGLSSIGTYVIALQDEPRRMADRPLKDVLSTLPPLPFVSRWNRDIDHWAERSKALFGEQCHGVIDEIATDYLLEMN